MGRKNKNKKSKKSHNSAISHGELRGRIMTAFRKEPGVKLNYKQVASRLEVSQPEGRKSILKVLNELADMEMLDQVSTGKFKLHPGQNAVIRGTIDFTKGGSAYVISDDAMDDIFVAEKNTGTALHGDRVEVSLIGGRRGRPEGKVTNVVERTSDQYVGVLEMSTKHAFVVPTNPRIHVDFYIDKSKLKNARNGEKVVVRILDWTDPTKSPFAEIVTVLGSPGENNVEMHAILVEFGLPYEFPQEVLDAANQIDVSISDEEISKRKDFRSFPTFTIDPEDAKDFDDALSIRPLDEDTFEVGIHIADVSHYVRPGSILDKEAAKRATSVYLVDRVVPMLPEVLSNFVCSLRPDEDKLCMSAVFHLTPAGKVKKEWFGKTIIRSDQRFTYQQAQDLIEGKEGNFASEIRQLNTWATQMRKDRIAHGALEFSGVEVKFKLDENGKPIGVYHKVMKEANFLIEEFMLLANKRVAAHIGKVKPDVTAPPFVYRVHDLPDPDKLMQLKDFVGRLGYKLKSVKPENASRALNELMHHLKDRPEEEIVKQMAIRTMSKAIYTTENIGHYGLAFDFYTHFTSPIRRYPDVMVHRLLEIYKHNGKKPDTDQLEKQARHASNMEKKAADAERASIKYKQAEYMLDKIGEHFKGSVSGLTRWGIYVELDDTKIEGMIPLNSLQDDTYRYDEKKNQLIGTRYHEVIEFGDTMEVKVESVDLLMKQLEFRRL